MYRTMYIKDNASIHGKIYGLSEPNLMKIGKYATLTSYICMYGALIGRCVFWWWSAAPHQVVGVYQTRAY